MGQNPDTMRTRLAFCFSVAVYFSAVGQSFEAVKIFLDKPVSDSVLVVARVMLVDNMSTRSSSRTYKASNGQTITDEGGTNLVHSPAASMNISVLLGKRLDRSFQAYVFGELAGTSTYFYTLAGVALINRRERYSLGIYMGESTKRVVRVSNIRIRPSHFEESVALGGYTAFDPKGFAFFAAARVEEARIRHRVYIAFKPGEVIPWKPLSGFRLFGESESFLGMGLGLSWNTKSRKFGASVAYIYPDNEERRFQKAIGNRLERGIGIRLWVQLL